MLFLKKKKHLSRKIISPNKLDQNSGDEANMD